MMFNRILPLLCLLLPFACNAGTASGRVISVYAASDSSVVLLKLDGELHDSPNCNKNGQFAFNTSSMGGENIYRAVLEAKARGYTVMVKGLNTCAGNWKSEDLRTIEIH
jgi:hypothetical protein